LLRGGQSFVFAADDERAAHRSRRRHGRVERDGAEHADQHVVGHAREVGVDARQRGGQDGGAPAHAGRRREQPQAETRLRQVVVLGHGTVIGTMLVLIIRVTHDLDVRVPEASER